jgi:hypothetical protein
MFPHRSEAIQIGLAPGENGIASSAVPPRNDGEDLRAISILVMAGLDPAIHVLPDVRENVDARVMGGAKRRRSSNGYARA